MRAAILACASALALAGCFQGSSAQPPTPDPSDKPVKGGTLTLLTSQAGFGHLDPQRADTNDETAFLGAYLTRSLTAYQLSPDGKASSRLVPDMATDTGTPSGDGTVWSFTLRDEMRWQDGTPVTCADLKYGISRSFAAGVTHRGPSYAPEYLDIPTATVRGKDGVPREASVYQGPYVVAGNDQAAYDRAVVCNGQQITFHLNRPVADFNHAVSVGMGAVPKAADTAGDYDTKIVSDGPYRIQEYTPGKELSLVRNENWNKSSDPYRPAYPDKVVVKFGLTSAQIDARLMADASTDRRSLSLDPLLTADADAVFKRTRDEHRRVDALSATTLFLAINPAKVTNLQHRQAIAAALDRAQLRDVTGGAAAGDLADSVVTPRLVQDHGATRLWSGLLGTKIADAGDPDLARTLIEQSGEPIGTLTYSYPAGPTGDLKAAVVRAALLAAGITTRLNPVAPGAYRDMVTDGEAASELMDDAWAPAWANASTVIPALFTPRGVRRESVIDDPVFNTDVDLALAETNRTKQAAMWKDLDTDAMRQVWVVPYLHPRQRWLAGSRVRSASGKDGRVYRSGPSGSWPYPDLYVD